MAGGDSGSKTEKASAKKRRDERKKGNVFQSKDIITVFSVLSIYLALKIMLPFIYDYMAIFMEKFIVNMNNFSEMTTEIAMQVLRDGAMAVILMAGPMLAVAMLVGIIASGVQTRFIISFESIKPKFSNMSIGKGIKRLFSMRSVVELIKSLIKVSVIGFVLYTDFAEMARIFPTLMAMDIMSGVVYILESVMGMVFSVVIAFAALSMFDYLYQWWDYEKKLKMSKQEVKEEYKHMEGDPQVKGKIKERQRKMAMQRMMQAVPTADVVVRNPTHFAVALRYNIEKDDAPIIVAKGQDLVALKIIELAELHGIPTTENPPLARALYKNVEPNSPIPYEFYTVIAEIMAWVFSLKQEKDSSGTEKK